MRLPHSEHWAKAFSLWAYWAQQNAHSLHTLLPSNLIIITVAHHEIFLQMISQDLLKYNLVNLYILKLHKETMDYTHEKLINSKLLTVYPICPA